MSRRELFEQVVRLAGYFTGFRQGDLRRLTKRMFTKQGFKLTEGKT